ncbi:MAG: hypothetical protein LBH58_01555 [Tannerellaceae bacterium]|jgi:hypothetical protein|nr:hypothetical protein [Tannerellaceae bacterium]
MDKVSKKTVQIIIPVYKTVLSALEKRSLQQAYTVMESYPITIIKPESLDVSALIAEFPRVNIRSFDDSYFRGISGYNKLMLSSTFYRSFIDTEYILIYQLDAFVFRDELSDWCSRGYDYIGAPWLKKPVYHLPVISWIMRYTLKLDLQNGKPNKQLLYNKVGNGGLSLRKVESHYQATEKHKEKIAHFLVQRRYHLFNEDVFWSTLPDFSYPESTEALRFSFDKYPRLSYELTGKQLPFGCHGWYKRKMKKFWQPIIKF